MTAFMTPDQCWDIDEARDQVRFLESFAYEKECDFQMERLRLPPALWPASRPFELGPKPDPNSRHPLATLWHHDQDRRVALEKKEAWQARYGQLLALRLGSPGVC